MARIQSSEALKLTACTQSSRALIK